MEAVKRWFRTSSPVVKTLMAISVTSAMVVVYRLAYAPHARRVRYRKAEEWANMIIEKEEAQAALESGENHHQNSF